MIWKEKDDDINDHTPKEDRGCCGKCFAWKDNIVGHVCHNIDCPCHSQAEEKYVSKEQCAAENLFQHRNKLCKGFTEGKCIHDGLSYLSNPPQLKCKNCGRFWFAHDETPTCKSVEINTIFPAPTAEPTKEWADRILKECRYEFHYSREIEYFKKELSKMLESELSKAREERDTQILSYLEYTPRDTDRISNECGICGGEMSEIRGKYPGQPGRKVCPACLMEILESARQNMYPNNQAKQSI